MPHRNGNVLEMLQLAYENDNAVARWNAATDQSQMFLRELYVETRLDSALMPAILDDQFDLVLITGNPGDGKTAFLDRLFRRGRTKSNRPIEIRHDATQPESDDRTAVAQIDLEYFLRDLGDGRWQPDKSAVRVIGINEGMLARSILDENSPFKNELGLLVRSRGRDPKSGFRVVVVNLNDRALVHLPLGSDENLLQALINRLTAVEFWEGTDDKPGCQACPVQSVATGRKVLALELRDGDE